ncbi:uncharacterized protein LOC142328468 isoform X3 [Lycorma delicatula]|uniref:uncharacterized protein LOC142328468 isoform X3 n=1 Tax=Lycorma delicatula TaxID=130591 RepID=UPI003F50E4C6
MATEKEASCQSCAADPNFAVICSFLERFAVQCGIPHPTFAELQEMIEDTEEVPQALIDLHVKLLRKARKSFSTEKWERTLIRFSHSYSPQDAWELERFGYKKARVEVKLRLLKMLLDAQFDLNVKFKTDINKLSAEELRGEPLGRDKMGHNYWCQFDPTANIRVYKEDQDEETWELVAKDREQLVGLITQLSSGENIDGLEDLLNEDSNSQDVEKPVLDTGQQDEDKEQENKCDVTSKPPEESVSVQKTDLMNGESAIMNGHSCEADQGIKDESVKEKADNETHVENVNDTDEIQNSISDSSVDLKNTSKNENICSETEVKDESAASKDKDIKQISNIESVNRSGLSDQSLPKLESGISDLKALNTSQEESLRKINVKNTSTIKLTKSNPNTCTDEEFICAKSLKIEEKVEISIKPGNKTASKESKHPTELKDTASVLLKDTCQILPSSKNGTAFQSDTISSFPKSDSNKSKLDAKLVLKDSLKEKSILKESSDIKFALKDSVKEKLASQEHANLSIPKDNVKEKSGLKENLSVKLTIRDNVKEKSLLKDCLDSKALLKERVEDVKPVKDHLNSKAIPKDYASIRSVPGDSSSDVKTLSKDHLDLKPALNLSINNSELLVGSIKDYAQSRMKTILQRPINQMNAKCVDLSSKRAERNVIDVTEEIKQRGALLKSNTGVYRGKGDGKSVPGSKLDEIFKLKRNLNPIINHPESQPLPAHFVGTSKSQLLEKMRISMSESLTLAGFSESGKFTQPKSQGCKPASKDAEDLSLNKLKRGVPEDLSFHASKKQHLEKELKEPVVSEAIEEPVMLVKGEGSGKECDTGNPGKDNDNLESNVKKDDSLTTVGHSKSDTANESTDQVNKTIKDNNHSSDDLNVNSDRSSQDSVSGNISDKQKETKIDLKENKTCSIISLDNSESFSSSTQTSKLENEPAELSKTTEKKIPKLWSIDTICSSGKNASTLPDVEAHQADNNAVQEFAGKSLDSNKSIKSDDCDLIVAVSEFVDKENTILVSEKSNDILKDDFPKSDDNSSVPNTASRTDSNVNVDKENQSQNKEKKERVREDKEKISDKGEKTIALKNYAEGDVSSISHASCTSKDNIKEPQLKGFFFGPGCVQMSNLVDLNKTTSEGDSGINKDSKKTIGKNEDSKKCSGKNEDSKKYSSKNEDFKKCPQDLNILSKSTSDSIEDKHRKKILVHGDLGTKPELKKTKVFTDSIVKTNFEASKLIGTNNKCDKEIEKKNLDSSDKKTDAKSENTALLSQLHYNNVSRSLNKGEVDKISSKLSSNSNKKTETLHHSANNASSSSTLLSKPVPKESELTTLNCMSSDPVSQPSNLVIKTEISATTDSKMSVVQNISKIVSPSKNESSYSSCNIKPEEPKQVKKNTLSGEKQENVTKTAEEIQSEVSDFDSKPNEASRSDKDSSKEKIDRNGKNEKNKSKRHGELDSDSVKEIGTDLNQSLEKKNENSLDLVKEISNVSVSENSEKNINMSTCAESVVSGLTGKHVNKADGKNSCSLQPKCKVGSSENLPKSNKQDETSKPSKVVKPDSVVSDVKKSVVETLKKTITELKSPVVNSEEKNQQKDNEKKPLKIKSDYVKESEKVIEDSSSQEHKDAEQSISNKEKSENCGTKIAGKKDLPEHVSSLESKNPNSDNSVSQSKEILNSGSKVCELDDKSSNESKSDISHKTATQNCPTTTEKKLGSSKLRSRLETSEKDSQGKTKSSGIKSTTQGSTSSDTEKNTLIGKVIIKDISEILKPNLPDNVKKDEKICVKTDAVDKEVNIKAVDNNVKPVSKISLKPLSQILKPELIAAQASMMGSQKIGKKAVKVISDVKTANLCSTPANNSNDLNKSSSVGGEIIPNKLRKTDQLQSEKEPIIELVSSESANKRVRKPTQKKLVKEKPDNKNSVKQDSSKVEAEKLKLETIKEANVDTNNLTQKKDSREELVKVGRNKQILGKVETEQFKLETELNILAVRQELKKRNSTNIEVVDEIVCDVEKPTLRNTRSRQRSTANTVKVNEKGKKKDTKLKEDLLDDDVQIIPEKDPLALTDDEITESLNTGNDPSKKDEQKNLSSFSLETVSTEERVNLLNKETKGKNAQKGDVMIGSRKRRSSRRLASKETDDDLGPDKVKEEDLEEVEEEEAGGKRRKVKGKRVPDINLRRSVEAKRGRKSSTSEDEGPVPDTFEGAFANFVSKKSRTAPVATSALTSTATRAAKRVRPNRGNQKHKNEVENEKKNDTEMEALTEDKEVKKEAEEKDEGKEEPKAKKKTVRASKCSAIKTSRLEIELGIDPKTLVNNDDDTAATEGRSVRASRRIAQIKIREQAERRQIEDALRDDGKKKKDKSKDKKSSNFSSPAKSKDTSKSKDTKSKSKKQKSKTPEVVRPIEVPVVEEKTSKKKKKKRKKAPSRAFDGRNPWASTSESSSSNEEEEEEEHYDIEEEEEELILKSDHEFSPESDLEKDGEEILPLRRARTAQKDEKDEGLEEEGPDYPCQKCSKSDHPEWILLCDKCDNGWHASCLRPSLMLIPEGDWFCPPCQHVLLVQKLQESLKHYDKETKRRTNEELRRKRLAYVGISLDNVLPIGSQEKHQKKIGSSSEESSSDEGSSDVDSDQSEEPVYQLRQRRQTLFSYRFNEYDDLINSAIQDELDAKGMTKKIIVPAETISEKPISDPSVNAPDNAIGETTDIKPNGDVTKNERDEKETAIKDDKAKLENGEKEVEVREDVEDDDYDEEEEVPRVVPKGHNTLSGGRKKQRRLNSLDVSSEDDDGSDEDFKGSSDEEEEEEENYDYTDDSEGGRHFRPVRRSSRARIARFDSEFINDDSEESDGPRRKKTRRVWQESDSEEIDKTWGRRKKKKSWVSSSSRSRSRRSKKKKKKHGKARSRILDSDEETIKIPRRKKPKIKYGLDEPADDLPSRRTRGRKINYQEVMGSDTEEEILNTTTRRIISDDEDEFKVEEEIKEKEKNSDSESGPEVEIAQNESGVDDVGNDTEKQAADGIGQEEVDEDVEEEEEDDDDDDDNDDEEKEDDEDDDEEEEEEDRDENCESKLGDENEESGAEENSNISNKVSSSLAADKIEKNDLKYKVNNDVIVPTNVNKILETKISKNENEAQSLSDGQEQMESIITTILDKKESEVAPRELPSLKMRISNQSVVPINSNNDSNNVKPPPKPLLSTESNTSSTVSVDLRQKLQLALSKKLKRTQDSESKSQASEGVSDDELEDSSEELLDEEELDELEEEEEAEEEDDEVLEEGEVPKKVVNRLQSIQAMQKKIEEDMCLIQKEVNEAKEKVDNVRPTVTSEPEKTMGIRVVSPLKLMANPPTSINQPPYARMPVGVPQQQTSQPVDITTESTQPTPPPKRRGRGRGKKQLAQEKAAQEKLAAERLAQEQQQLVSGGSVIRGMLQSGQPPHSFTSVPRHYSNQLQPRSDAGRGVQFPSIPRGRLPFPVQHFNPNPSHRLGRPPQQLFHSSHHPLDPSPSGGGPINIQTPSSKTDSSLPSPSVSSPQGKSTPPHPAYHRPQGPPSGIRFPPPDSNSTRHSLPFMSSSQTSNRPTSYPSYHHPSGYPYSVAGYPAILGEDALPPAAYQGSPSQYSEHFSETNAVTSDTSNSKSYDEEVSGGEFGGLVSYFSSQREDDLET